MTLRRTMAYEIAATIVGLLLISAASLWGLNGLRQEFYSAISGYEELRQAYEISSHAATARTLLSLSRPEDQRAMEEIQLALGKFDLFWPGGPATAPAESPDEKSRLRLAVRGDLVEGSNRLRLAIIDHPAHDAVAAVDPLNRALIQVANLAGNIRRTIQEKQIAGDSKRRTTMIVMSVLCAGVMVGVIVVGIWQYRSVMNPLSRLGHGVRTIAAGRFSDRVAPEGHAEFAALADDFNRMATELDGLYRQLELKVAAKSKELVRSERLASVGFLAAGVAHEISNPIGIIAGHAELSLQELQRKGGVQTAGDVEKAMRVICDEAFRCKQIIDKLLSLARPGEENRRRISLAAVASDVVSMIGSLSDYRSRRLTLQADPSAGLDVMASEGEMKQVVLNLVLNALEAVRDEGGEVRIGVARADGFVELSVTDNGRGMTAEVLERIFEPFFTAKRGSAQPGTGLGLSITHAIVEAHGGQIRAFSDGVGQGSRFVVRLPAASEGGGR